MLRRFRLLPLVCVLVLSACRMPVEISGKGFVFGEQARAVYVDGYMFDIEEDFEEVFWPVPAPGHSFSGWTQICNRTYGPCELALTRKFWQEDVEIPLATRFRPDYRGPLSLVDYDLYWNAATRTLSIPVSSLVVDGVHADDEPRLFMASMDMEDVIPARRVGSDYRFQIQNNTYSVDDYWLFVSATDSDGVIASISIEFGLDEQIRQDELKPHSKRSPYADVLSRCVSANNPFELCTLETLPFLGSESTNPSVSDVLQRTVVTHGWMGLRFAEVLNRLPPDMLKLFRGVTAVVISSRVRPAFYIATSGAIYLDPQDLWLNPTERATINWEPDYRSGFGSALGFISADVYVDGNQLAWFYSSQYEEWESRRVSDIVRPLANLLIHELTHANDAMPPAFLPLVSSEETPLDAIFRFDANAASTLLANTMPLRSELLAELGKVLFQGFPASALIQSLTPRAVGLEFAADDANALYGYSTSYEDTAMLVEEVLTRYYFGVDRVASFLEVPASEEPSCTEFTVRWGVRNRVATPRVRARAELVLREILDEADVSTYLDSVPDTEALQRGIGLCESLPRLPSVNAAPPGKFISPAELARVRAIQVDTHRKMRGQVGRGRIVRDVR
ncbi:hypothetical protein F0M18_11730 [Pseudohalioglobus sediminis]|uniref:Uncharacterized protein n=1 Tax=Pseudohalioglobus sediminis TaxID=2606449 RepID=A0A5B0WVQ8_9GAMM|nr:hypothetical protein [Pseudohalioglobus sediminis]KAA1190478.1 hypothetical protein F0M18_11730 [Pseudohalioglobus sediminis]